MLLGAQPSFALQQRCVRLFATRNIPPKPRSSLRRAAPPQKQQPPSPQSARSPSQNTNRPNEPPTPPPSEPSKVEAVSKALATTSDAANSLITPVHIPEDPHGIIKETHPAMRILENSAIVVQRQLEMMNVLMGFEQANRYVIMDPHGNHIGYLAELDHGVGRAVARQMFRTHRSFTTHVFDKEEREVLRFHRPFAWINSRIRVYDALGNDSSAYTSSGALQGTSPGSALNQTIASISSLPLSDMRIIGSAEQEWAPLRRKYNLFLAREIDAAVPDTPKLTSGELPLSNSKALVEAESDNREIGMVQFARVDEPFLSWDFRLMSENQRLIGSVNRSFGGFAREIFTDTGVYALRMDAAGLQEEVQHAASVEQAKALQSESHPGMTLDQRAVMLATAVSVDFDYFSRHSGSGGMLPMWPFWMGGGGEATGAAAEAGAPAGTGEAAGAGTAIGAAGETGIASEAGAAARGVGSAEGWAAGAGTMAGYEAMQRARGQHEGSQGENDPAANGQGEEDIWSQGRDPWADQANNDPWRDGGSTGGSSGGGGGGDGGGGGGFDIGDWF